MKIRNLSSRNLYLRDSSNTEYRVPAYSDITVADTLWTDNEFRRWVRYRVRDIAVVDTSATISASTLINTGDPLTVPFTVRGALGQNVDLIQFTDNTPTSLVKVSKTGQLAVGSGLSPLTPVHIQGAITTSGAQLRVDASTSNSNAALSLFPNRAGSLFEAARLLATYNGALQGQLQFYTNDGTGTLIQRGMFDETGALGVGATPTKRLDIATAVTGDVATFRTTAGGGQGLLFGIDTTNSLTYLRLNTSSTYSYAIQNTAGTALIQFNNADGKTYFGSPQDTNLYRSAADTLKTDDSLVVGANMTVTGTLTTGSLSFTGGSVTGSLTVTQDLTARSGGATQVLVGTVAANAGLAFGSAGDANLYRTGASALKTDGAFATGLGQQLLSDSGTAANGIRFGSTADTTLYRLSAGVLKTDGALTTVGAITSSSTVTGTQHVVGNLSFQSRVASELSLINANSNGTFALRLDPSGTPTDVLTVSSIGNVTLPVTAANATPTIFLGAEPLYRSSTGVMKTDSSLIVAGGLSHNYGTVLPTAGLFNGYRYTLFTGGVGMEFVYRADLDGTYPWHCVGGGALRSTNTTLTLPNGGYWDIDVTASVSSSGSPPPASAAVVSLSSGSIAGLSGISSSFSSSGGIGTVNLSSTGATSFRATATAASCVVSVAATSGTLSAWTIVARGVKAI